MTDAPDDTRKCSVSVTVVVRSSSESTTLSATLKAVRDQSYRPLEAVVVLGPFDDGAAEASRRHVDVKFVVSPRRGLAAARNSGVRVAGGEIVAFIDDAATPNARWIEQLMHVYRREGDDCAAVGGMVIDGRSSDATLSFRNGQAQRDGTLCDVRLEPGGQSPTEGPWFNRLHASNMSFRRKSLIAVGGFDETFRAGWDDIEICARLALGGHRVAHHGRAPVRHSAQPPNSSRDYPNTVREWIRGRTCFRVKHAQRGVRGLFAALVSGARLLVAQARKAAFWRGAGMRAGTGIIASWLWGLAGGAVAGWRSRRRPTALALDSEPARHGFLPLAKPIDGPTVVRSRPRRALSIALACRLFENGFNGISEYTRLLAESFTARGHEVAVFRSGGTRRPSTPRTYQVVDVRPQGDLYQAALGRAVDEHARSRRVDLVEAPLWLGEACGLGLLVPYPLVTRLVTPADTIHQTARSTHERERTYETEAERLQLGSSSGVIGISRAVSETVERLFALKLEHAARRAAVIPLGLPSARDVPIEPRELPVGKGAVILFVGRMHERKGVLELGAAFARLAETYPDARLWVAGKDFSAADGYFGKTGLSYIESMRAMWSEPTSRRVSFFGAVTDAEKNFLISRSDLVVVPSRYESFGLVLLEAMRFGKPVVASAVGGMCEIVEPGVTGLLVPAESPIELAGALADLSSNRARRTAMGHAALERFHQHYELQRCVARTEDFYYEVLDRFENSGAIHC